MKKERPWWCTLHAHQTGTLIIHLLGIRMCIFASHQCTDYVCASYMYAGAGEARMTHVAFAAWEAVYSIQATMAPLRRRPWPLSQSPKKSLSAINIWVERIWVCQTVWRTYGLYLWYVTTFRVTFLSVTHQVRTYVCTHVRTYVLCENGSSIQSLALMRSAIIEHQCLWFELCVTSVSICHSPQHPRFATM